MPLKVIRRPDTGSLVITGTVRPAGTSRGIHIRRRAGSDNLAMAKEEARAIEREILLQPPDAKPVHTFQEAVLSYIENTDQRSVGTIALLNRLVAHIGDLPLSAISQECVDRARTVVLRANAAPATVKRNLIVPLRAVMIHAAKRGWCAVPLFDIPREPKGRTRFMLPAEFERLREAASPHLRPLLTFLVSTGCRMAEAIGLEWSEVDLKGARAILHEDTTKSGSRRVVLLPPATVTTLAVLPNRTGRVFLNHRGLSYRGSQVYGGQIKTAWRTACLGAGLEGYTPHHLRHTWATWSYGLHKDLLRLKAEGGWSSVALVERYSHLMPAGYEMDIERVLHVAYTDRR